MASPRAAWGIEVGANAIKALRLERDGTDVAVTDFSVIPHKKVLTTPDLDQDEMVRLTLGQFISQKDLEGEHLVMSVPGHAAFARFAKLPPVEPKKVPDIVKFEAVQQIPFPIEEVEWDYQTFAMEDSPEIEVGIFAMTRDRVQQMLDLYGELGVSPETLTLSPVAVYNAMAHDNDLRNNPKPIVYLDIGTRATDVVIAEEGRCWIRTFPLGGTHFTEAIANAFKISYSKAEKLKQEAATSKYAKQIMQAMRPVFSDLLQDLQRSIGYYNSMHRDIELNTMVGIGSTFKIPGLRKFLGQQLQINVLRLDEYRRISVTGREAAAFAESSVNMATAYGLALQGVGLAQIDANLVPSQTLREQIWRSKTKWFAAAAAIALVGGAATFYPPLAGKASLDAGGVPRSVQSVTNIGGQLRDEMQQLQADRGVGHMAENVLNLFRDRQLWPYLLRDISDALASTNPQQELLSGDLDQILSIPPAQRRLVELRELHADYKVGEDGRRMAVTAHLRLSHDRPVEFLNQSVARWLRDNAERSDVPYRIRANTISFNPREMEEIRVTEDAERREDGRGRPGAGSGPGRTGGGFGGLGGGAGRLGAPPPDDDRRTGRPGDGEGRHGSLDEIAPLPSAPRIYPAGSAYYRVKLTFEVELMPDDRPLVPDHTAGRDDAAQEQPS